MDDVVNESFLLGATVAFAAMGFAAVGIGILGGNEFALGVGFVNLVLAVLLGGFTYLFRPRAVKNSEV